CWNRSFAGRGMYMKDSIKYGDEGGKDFGCAADGLTPQACYRSGGITAYAGQQAETDKGKWTR
ncbi:MAG: hypothetical protein QRY16_19520, partial [Enterobacterales bacterium endosymbiont of Blomia tropicalis]|uniref:hypothetical protein n=1 Tax=Mixta mediterraneensis TaxID=2758443 RepID=UPI0025A7F4D1